MKNIFKLLFYVMVQMNLQYKKKSKKRAGSASVIHWYGPANPVPYQKVTNPEPWF
jgi:hypothetical protein